VEYERTLFLALSAALLVITIWMIRLGVTPAMEPWFWTLLLVQTVIAFLGLTARYTLPLIHRLVFGGRVGVYQGHEVLPDCIIVDTGRPPRPFKAVAFVVVEHRKSLHDMEQHEKDLFMNQLQTIPLQMPDLCSMELLKIPVRPRTVIDSLKKQRRALEAKLTRAAKAPGVRAAIERQLEAIQKEIERLEAGGIELVVHVVRCIGEGASREEARADALRKADVVMRLIAGLRGSPRLLKNFDIIDVSEALATGWAMALAPKIAQQLGV